jgi:hypothetical protein
MKLTLRGKLEVNVHIGPQHYGNLNLRLTDGSTSL